MVTADRPEHTAQMGSEWFQKMIPSDVVRTCLAHTVQQLLTVSSENLSRSSIRLPESMALRCSSHHVGIDLCRGTADIGT
jgi:hypothetical protein